MSSDSTPRPAAPPRRPLTSSAWAGVILALAGAAFFATKGIVIKLALLQGIDSVTTLTWRMIVAGPIFLVVGIFTYRRRVKAQPVGAPPVLTWPILIQTLFVGLLGYYVSSALDFSALEYISAQLDRLILLTYPFFVVLFGVIFYRRRITMPTVLALLVSYLGIAVIFWHDLKIEGDNVFLGAGLVFAASIAYAAYQILAKPLIDRLGSQLFTSIAMSGACPGVIVHFFVTHPASDLMVSGTGFWLMVAIGTMATVVPAYCISAAIGMIGPERTAIIGNISPVVTVGLAIGVLGELFTPWHALGTALVLVGVWLFARKEKPKDRVLEEQTA